MTRRFFILVYISAFVLGTTLSIPYLEWKKEGSNFKAYDFNESDMEKDEDFALYQECSDSLMHRIFRDYRCSERVDEKGLEGLGFYLLMAHRFDNLPAYYHATWCLKRICSKKADSIPELSQRYVQDNLSNIERLEKQHNKRLLESWNLVTRK